MWSEHIHVCKLSLQAVIRTVFVWVVDLPAYTIFGRQVRDLGKNAKADFLNVGTLLKMMRNRNPAPEKLKK